MSRPKRRRRLCFCPKCYNFKPENPSPQIGDVGILADEIEAIKLHDFDGLDQIKAASEMEISQSTFARILASGRKKMAEAVCMGKAIKIQK